MVINFFSAEDGVELAALELAYVPDVGDFITIDGSTKRVKAVELTIMKNEIEAIQVLVRDLRPTDMWRKK